jgi:hypothetical protein
VEHVNYDRIKDIFVNLYEELCDTFDAFESDFSEVIGQEVIYQSKLYPEQNDVIKYFEKITETREAAECFIRELLAPAVKARNKFDVSSSYHYLIAKETLASHIIVGKDSAVNYNAFIKKLTTEFKLYKKDVHELIKETNNIRDKDRLVK